MIIVVISWSRERISERDQGSENGFMALSLLKRCRYQGVVFFGSFSLELFVSYILLKNNNSP
jgi:hypothetical protein